MRIAIFGGTGFVGFHLLKFLCEENIHVNALVRSGSEAKLWKNDNISCISGDISSEASVSQTVEGCEYVIYSIGIFKPYLNISYGNKNHYWKKYCKIY